MDLKEAIARLFYPYGSIRTVLRGPLRGYEYIVSPAMGVTYALGIDENSQKFFFESVSEGAVVFDVGANKGQLTLPFAHIVGENGKVVAIEPVEELAELIRRNTKLNDLNNVEVVEAAASSQKGTAEFEYPGEQSTQGMLSGTEPTYVLPEAKTISVHTMTLDEIAKARSLWPDMIKVDVEGGARLVFEGAQKTLDRGPDVFIEQHGPREQEAVKDELIDRGYTARTLSGDLVSDPTDEWHNPLWCTKS